MLFLRPFSKHHLSSIDGSFSLVRKQDGLAGEKISFLLTYLGVYFPLAQACGITYISYKGSSWILITQPWSRGQEKNENSKFLSSWIWAQRSTCACSVLTLTARECLLQYQKPSPQVNLTFCSVLSYLWGRHSSLANYQKRVM